ncbi:MAG TPA: hypothetical protein VHE30_30645 [Polyangiaceae bacterium]|nr:hypothetical protein [Polyangiaceae bacterium]
MANLWVGVLLVACGGSATDGVVNSSPGAAGNAGNAASDAGSSAGGSGNGSGGIGSSAGGVAGTSGGIGGTSTGGTSTGGACATGPFGDCVTITPPPPGPSYCGGVACAGGEECCLATLTCFARSNPSACAAPPPDDDPQGLPTCASNADCGSDGYCESPQGQCGGAGHCVSRWNCGSSSGSTYCGCDGKTYADVQSACNAGVRVAAMGECGKEALLGGGGSSAGLKVVLCGADTQCPSGQTCCSLLGYCLDAAHVPLCVPPPPGATRACLTDADCYLDGEFCDGEGCEGPGGCVTKSGSCGPTLNAVCGCDAQTYLNADCAKSVGVRIAFTGTCG